MDISRHVPPKSPKAHDMEQPHPRLADRTHVWIVGRSESLWLASDRIFRALREAFWDAAVVEHHVRRNMYTYMCVYVSMYVCIYVFIHIYIYF